MKTYKDYLDYFDSHYDDWDEKTVKIDTPSWITGKEKECECGLDAAIAAGASGGKHAPYCPKYKKEKE